ncbi:hypothetical protein AGMMS49992_13090 [Clostridia bacterium]|nr:hypothetical protein AGMMS49992_13090 [Clostridia bacterium]
MNSRKHPVKRLHGLGRKLSLINMGISGAILVVIASIALGIADRTIAQQGARDLGLYVRAVHTMLAQTMGEADAEGALLRLPERYQVYYKGGQGEQEDGAAPDHRWRSISGGAALSEDEVSILIEDGMGYRVSVSAVQPYRSGQVSVVWPPPDSAEGTPTPRATGTLLVLQNLKDEMGMRVRMRWLFAGLTLGGMGLIVLASLHVSRQSIQPIEDSIRQQRQFVASASHELRTPVTALNANAEVLADAPLGEYSPYLDSIRSVGERMTRLIQDLIDLARADAGELPIAMDPVDAREATADALGWIRPLADKRGIQVLEELETVYLQGDAGRVRQVLLALMDNALRYTPAGGRITVTLKREGRHVRLSVADTGMGIPEASKPRVFDRFYRTDEARDREHGGAGLGLSVVKQLTEGMRGTVAIQDNPGGGTIFTLRFIAAA